MYCGLCEGITSHYFNGSLDPNNHSGGTRIENAQATTCYIEGYTGDRYCLGCGVLLESGSAIPKTTHDPAISWTTDSNYHWHVCQNPGCTEQLSKAAHCGGEATCVRKAQCDVCGAEYGAFDSNNHKNTEIRNARAATEENTGYTGDLYCKDCNTLLERGRTVPKLDHTHALIATAEIQATCTTAGNIAYWYCEKCGKYYADADAAIEVSMSDTTIAALGHNFGAWTVTTPATCSEGGIETKFCSRCDATLTHSIPALGHNYVSSITAPKCTEEGYTTYTCSRCGDSYVANNVAALGHSFGAWTLTTPATCTVSGEETRYCSRCDAFETRVIDALGHNLIHFVATEATADVDGNIEYWKCEACGKYFSDAEAESEITPDAIIVKYVPKFALGDVNHDGNINARDIIAIMKHLVGYEVDDFDISLADYDGNGRVNARDVVAIMLYIIKETS